MGCGHDNIVVPPAHFGRVQESSILRQQQIKNSCGLDSLN